MRVFHQVILYLLAAWPAVMYSQSFEKITIRPDLSADPRNMKMQVLPDGDLTATAVPVTMLLSYAYDVPSNPSPRLNSLPEWAVGERYDVEAKAPGTIFPVGFPESGRQRLVQRMVRQLLADRFKLEMQVEDKAMAIYALKVASGGPKLETSASTARRCIFDTAPDGCHSFVIGFGHPLNGNSISMNDLAHYIENWTDLPVVNHTNLVGLYTVSTQGWQPMRLPPPPPNSMGGVSFASLPTIFTVLGRLGLELQRQEETMPVYSVHRIERPSAY